MARGYSDEDIAKIWGGNWLRVMERVWGDPEAQLIEDDHRHEQQFIHEH
jgi:hypothetical protein